MREISPTTLHIKKRSTVVQQHPVVLSCARISPTADLRKTHISLSSQPSHIKNVESRSLLHKIVSGVLIVFLLVNPSIVVFAATEEITQDQSQEVIETIEEVSIEDADVEKPIDVFIAEEESVDELVSEEPQGETSEAIEGNTEESAEESEASTQEQSPENVSEDTTAEDDGTDEDSVVTNNEDKESNLVSEEEDVEDVAGGDDQSQTPINTSSSQSTSHEEDEHDEEVTEESGDVANDQNTEGESLTEDNAENEERVEEVIEEVVEEEKAPEPVVDEAAIRAEIEKVVEERIKREYEEKMKALLNERQNETLSISNFQSTHEFSDSDCELLSNNEIYCRKDGVTSDQKTSVFTGVFTDDSSEDSEIILQISGVATQITNNEYSDTNPVFDEATGKVVWQSLIDGRWQVMMYDVHTAETFKITGGGYNNINPHTFGNVIVWQGWAGSNWDIFYAKQVVDEQGITSWETTRVTDNDWPDVEPQVVEGMILWEALINDSWQVFSFDVYTSTLTQVSQGVGDSKNPRLVLLYESQNGDVTQLVGFDVATQESEIIDDGLGGESVPQEIPENPLNENQAAMPGHENTTSSSSRASKDASDGE